MTKFQRFRRALPFLCAMFAIAHFGTAEDLDYRIDVEVAYQDFDGSFCWFHPRAASLPGGGGVITMQKWFLTASDYFSGLSTLATQDLGGTWTPTLDVPELAWRDEPDGVTVGICDVTPSWHAPTGRILAIGHTVRYHDGKLIPDPRPRQTGYSAFDPETNTWTPWKFLEMDDAAVYFSAGSGCAQRVNEPDGTVLVPIYFKGEKEGETYATQVLRCAFDGETLTVLDRGEPLRWDVPRGIYEPSVTFFDGRYYLTLRNDETGFVTVSDDGLNFAPPKPWAFDDGSNLGSYNTQQHWATHSDGLFLVYTRRGANNDHIARHRAPLFIAQVDPVHLHVIRTTERVAVPERGARLGNFGVAAISPTETWITVGEGMWGDAAERGATGAVFLSRITWDRPNALFDRLR